MRLALTCALALVLAPTLPAGIVRIWSIDKIADAPALVVATVESVTPRDAVPRDKALSSLPERYFEATLRVHRVYPPRTLSADERIQVRYISNDGFPAGGVTGHPMWPQFEKGTTSLIALAPGDSGPWSLVATEGSNLTVPALADNVQPQDPPLTGRAFILGELANALANGETSVRYRAAVYLRESRNPWPADFRALLEQAVGTDDDRWLEIACATLASLGIPHSSVNEMMANPNGADAVKQSVAWVLAKGAKRDYPDHLLLRMLRNMPSYDWGAANTLLEFKDSPLVIREMTTALTRDPDGSIYAAWVLLRNGQRDFVREAVEAAVKLVSDPRPVLMNRLQASSWILRDYGTEQQFDVIPATLRRLKTTDEDSYRKLFGSINYSESKRELRVAAVLIDDRRPGFGKFRYCDVAAGMVQKLSGENFGITPQDMTTAEYDRAVALAIAWLNTHKL